MDHPHHHALQVEYVLVSQMLLVPNVQLVCQAFMDFPTAKVTIKQLCYLVPVESEPNSQTIILL